MNLAFCFLTELHTVLALLATTATWLTVRSLGQSPSGGIDAKLTTSLSGSYQFTICLSFRASCDGAF